VLNRNGWGLDRTVVASDAIWVILNRRFSTSDCIMPLWNLYYHFVWATHERRPLITPIREAPLYQFIDHKTTELGGSLHAIGGIADHIHVIVSSPPSLALSEYIRLIKGSSSRYLNANYPNPSAKFKWQQEYGVFSISPKNLDLAITYAQTQKRHHAQGTTFPQLEPDAIFTPNSP
jgi:putative transposase